MQEVCFCVGKQKGDVGLMLSVCRLRVNLVGEEGVVGTDGSEMGTRMDSFGDRKMFFLCYGPIWESGEVYGQFSVGLYLKIKCMAIQASLCTDSLRTGSLIKKSLT